MLKLNLFGAVVIVLFLQIGCAKKNSVTKPPPDVITDIDNAPFSKPTFVQDPAPSGNTWSLIQNLSDEFSNGSLDTQKWTSVPTAKFTWTGKEPALFVEENSSVKSGALNLEHTIFESTRTVDGLDRYYGGGIVRSIASADVGTYYEARVKAGHTPFSTAFWVINLKSEKDGCKRTTELDVLECIGRRSVNYSGPYAFNTNWVGQMHSNVLSRQTACPATYPDDATQQSTKPLPSGKENWQEYHVYGAWIKSANEIQFYLDGVLWKTVIPSTPFDATKMYVTMSSNVYDWNRGLNTDPNDDKIDPDFIITTGGKKYLKTDKDPLTAEGKYERSAHFDWVRCWKLQ